MIKILLVDDEPFARIVFKSLINWEENEFVIEGEASNGKDALEAIKIINPDIIITDIKMPVMDGIELIKEVCKLKSRPEIIVLSCFDDFKYVKDALKMGAADYLIKSDIKPQQLLDILSGIKRKIEENWANRKKNIEMTNNLNKSLNYLREAFLKDLINGEVKNEHEILEQIKILDIALLPEKLVLMKIKLDDIRLMKKKYSEKDDSFLRFSVVNILKEIIPGRINNELIVEKPYEYVLILNIDEEEVSYFQYISKLYKKISSVMKDFLNISVSIGTSTVINSFRNLRIAYNQAEEAVNMRFFVGKGRITFFDYLRNEDRKICKENLLSKAMESAIKVSFENLNRNSCINRIKELHDELIKSKISEAVIRKNYIRVIELLGASIPIQIQIENESSSALYEEILLMETCEEIHDYTLNYIDFCFNMIGKKEFIDYKSNVEKAVEIIGKCYHEDISLQTVAKRINLNPSYLSRIFKQATGENFITYLTRVRIEKAKYYLESKRLKVYEISEKVGYQNYTYFSRIFKRVVGISPEEYKGKNSC